MIFPTNEAMFSGSVGGAYVGYFRDVSFLAGNPNVAFRFNFASDVNLNAAGVAIDNFYITGPSNPPSGFPVDASPLVGQWVGENVQLDWETYSETNNQGFTLMRSEDGQHFVDMDFVNGAGTINHAKAYTWVDEHATEDHYYYRYRQTDFNGTSHFSNTVELHRQALQDAVMVYPNPFGEILNIRLNSVPSGGSVIELWSMEGRQILKVAPNWTQDGLAVLSLPGDLAAGNYLLHLRSGSQVRTLKVQHRN
jgi:hypothetical protein